MPHTSLDGSKGSAPSTPNYSSPRLPGLNWDQWRSASTQPSSSSKNDERS